MTDDIHEIYAVRYAHHDRPASANYLGSDPHDSGNDPLDYFVWAIVGASGTFVVDTGFDDAMAVKRKRQVIKPIGEGLKAIGIDPDSVKNVIISHLHYDHAGNHDLFPNARYHIQDMEMGYATGRLMCHAHLKTPFEVDDVVSLVRKVYAGRVTFHDGVDEIAPGITVHKVGGHSKGLQCIRVKTRRGWVVVAADTAHLYKHVDENKVFPTTYNIGEVLEGYGLLRKLATSPRHIIPGHDPQVLTRYAAAKPGLENWVVRLDADPKG